MTLIKLKQAPIIEFSEMEARGIEVQQQIAEMNIDSIESTEENRGMMKKMRSTLNKELGVFEDQRKMIHGKITQPYNDFKQSYESNIKILYQKSSEQLKNKISEVETKMLDEKILLLKSYFEDNNQHDFLSFDSINLNIILSASDKKLKNQIDEFLNKINTEVESINAMDNSVRILGYYQKTLDLPDSISTVNADIKREKELEEARIAQEKADKERKEREAIEAKKRQELLAKQAVEKAEIEAKQAEEKRIQAEKNAQMQTSKEAEEAAKQAANEARIAQEKQSEAIAIQKKIEEEKEKEKALKEEEEKIYTARFEVSGTMKQLKKLKQIMNEQSIKFEVLK